MPEPNYSIEITLTFDDGPDGSSLDHSGHSATPYNTTERVMNVLMANSVQNDIKAAFFVQTQAPGHMAEAYGKQVVKTAHARGHIIGLQNGSPDERPNHPQRMKDRLLKADLDSGRAALKMLLGAEYNLRYVRGPFGLVDTECIKTYDTAGLSYVFWAVSAEDLRPENSPSVIEERLQAQVRRVADRVRKTGQARKLVVELHDTSHITAAYLERFLIAIRDGGNPYRPPSKKAPTNATPVSVTFCRSKQAVADGLDAIAKLKLTPRIPTKGKLARLLQAYGTEDKTLQAWDVIWFEGWIPYLYLDNLGKVTVGVGHLLPTAASAEELTGLKKEGGATSAKDRSDAWKSIANLKTAEDFDPAEHAATYYAHLAIPDLMMKDGPIEETMRTDIAIHEQALINWVGVTFYAQCPLPVRLALFDMMYNLGPKKMKKYHDLLTAVQNRDWAEAGNQSERKGPPRKRNVYTKALFNAAAVLDPPPRISPRLPRSGTRHPGTADPTATHLEMVDSLEKAAIDPGPGNFAIIAVVGRTWKDSDHLTPEDEAVLGEAAEVGRQIRSLGHAVLTGGHIDHPERSVKYLALAAAKEAKASSPARLVGIVPVDISDKLPGTGYQPDVQTSIGTSVRSIFVHTQRQGRERDSITANAADVLIALKGRAGTPREVVAAFIAGRPVVFLNSWDHLKGEIERQLKALERSDLLPTLPSQARSATEAVREALWAIGWETNSPRLQGALTGLADFKTKYDQALLAF